MGEYSRETNLCVHFDNEIAFELYHFYPSIRGHVTNTEPFVHQMRYHYITWIHEQRSSVNYHESHGNTVMFLWKFVKGISSARFYED